MRYVSIMDIITRSHRMTEAFPSMVFIHDVNPRIGYWYAEKRLYVCKDEKTGGYYFVKERSPREAVERVLESIRKGEES